MRYKLWLIPINLLLMCIFLSIVLAESNHPPLTGYVNDFANILTDGEEAHLNNLITQIAQNTTIEIAIVTVLNTNGEDNVMFSNYLGEKNGVGDSATDNGVIVLWSLDNNKGGGIATGRGIESILNDAKVGRIGRAARPLFDQERYADGFEYIIVELGKEMGYTLNSTVSIPEQTHSNSIPTWAIILVIIIIILIILFALSSSGGGRGGSYRATSYIGRSHGSFSSGGFKGFGGGSFGGGGARF